MHRSEESRRRRAVARREGRGGMLREVVEGMRVVSQEREGMGREVVRESVVSWRWRVRAVSILVVWLWLC